MHYKTHRGTFKPTNPLKYKGNPTQIVYRSGWEFRCMRFFDQHPDIISWSSEEIIVPYRSPLDNRVHRYFPDFVCVMNGRDGKQQTRMIEVKPYAQSIPPMIQNGKRTTKKYLREVTTYVTNQAKWAAATEYCANRGWTFSVLTERELFGK